MSTIFKFQIYSISYSYFFSVKFELNNKIQVKESEQPGENENKIVVLNKKDEENGENSTG